MDNENILKHLDRVLQERKSALPSDSYVASLYDGGERRMVDKILEEAKELAEAGVSENNAHVIQETADLWFHSLVLLASKNINSTAVLNELAKRFGISGHQEKRNRNRRN